jgi:tetratricopeptide (TPR) repeat protein
VDLQNGNLDAAIDAFNALTQTNYPEARARGFDFSLDYRLQNTLAQTLFERSKLAASNRMEVEWLDRAANHYQQSLHIDPENVTAHYGLAQVYARLDRSTQAEKHRQLHQKYRRDDNAHDLALASARRSDPAANHASEAVVIYELQRRGAYGLPVDR